MSAPHTVAYPLDGTWRLGRGPDPYQWRHPDPVDTETAGAGNRFDSFHGDYGVVYSATTQQACFAETLARFRPDPILRKLVEDEWHQRNWMKVASVPADWRNSRLLIRLGLEQPLPFVDAAHSDTLTAFGDEPRISRWLQSFCPTNVDLADIIGQDRRVTRLLSAWAFDTTDHDDAPMYGGIRYTSRLGANYECWAIFEGNTIVELERQSIAADNTDLDAVATQYDLTIH